MATVRVVPSDPLSDRELQNLTNRITGQVRARLCLGLTELVRVEAGCFPARAVTCTRTADEFRVLLGTVFSTVSYVSALEVAKAVAVPKQNVKKISVVAIISLARNLNPPSPASNL